MAEESPYVVVIRARSAAHFPQPETADRQVTPDTSRARVLIDGEPLPWDAYAENFEAKMPADLRQFQEEIASGSSAKDHSAAIRERLSELRDLFTITRYRPNPEGAERVDHPNAGGTPAPREEAEKRDKSRPGRTGGRAGNVYALFQKPDGITGQQTRTDTLPEIDVTWVSVDDATRAAPYLEDRAGSYDRRHTASKSTLTSAASGTWSIAGSPATQTRQEPPLSSRT